MKKLFLIVLALGMAMGVSAQKYIPHYYSHPRVIISGGYYAPLYPYYGFGFPYYGYPYYGPNYGYSHRPTKLEMQIQDIKNDYKDRIYSARHDKSLSKSERKEIIHQLKRERDQAINDAESNYHKTS